MSNRRRSIIVVSHKKRPNKKSELSRLLPSTMKTFSLSFVLCLLAQHRHVTLGFMPSATTRGGTSAIHRFVRHRHVPSTSTTTTLLNDKAPRHDVGNSPMGTCAPWPIILCACDTFVCAELSYSLPHLFSAFFRNLMTPNNRHKP